MNTFFKRTGLFCSTLIFMVSTQAYSNEQTVWEDYCVQSDGVVEHMPAEYDTMSGSKIGNTKLFCNFYLKDAFISIGLATFASEKPSLAATYIKQMKEISNDSPLWQGNSFNPSQNVCKNIGGTTIGLVANGAFVNALGRSDICVFGDGSMVSGWSLIHMANHREGYDDIKEKVRAQPLNIPIPNTFEKA